MTELINQSPTSENTIIKTKNLECKMGHRYLLRGVNWEVKAGEHWVVFGMNGSGKTTLLSIISGMQQYTAGEVQIFDHEIDEHIIEMRQKIGFVSASFFGRIYSNESALNIILSGINGTFSRDNKTALSDIKKALQILAEFNLEDKADYPFYMFSKGEQQNILIARAMINNPALLILDEPCTGLDIYNREYLFKTIEELSQKEGLSIIYVTHYVEEIMPLFKKILLLKNGMVFAQGAINELLTKEVISDFIEHPVQVLTTDEAGYHIKVECQSSLVAKLS